MGIAEDPHKVGRIVAGSRAGLEDMYLPLMTPGGPLQQGCGEQRGMQEGSAQALIPTLVTQVNR